MLLSPCLGRQGAAPPPGRNRRRSDTPSSSGEGEEEYDEEDENRSESPARSEEEDDISEMSDRVDGSDGSGSGSEDAEVRLVSPLQSSDSISPGATRKRRRIRVQWHYRATCDGRPSVAVFAGLEEGRGRLAPGTASGGKKTPQHEASNDPACTLRSSGAATLARLSLSCCASSSLLPCSEPARLSASFRCTTARTQPNLYSPRRAIRPPPARLRNLRASSHSCLRTGPPAPAKQPPRAAPAHFSPPPARILQDSQLESGRGRAQERPPRVQGARADRLSARAPPALRAARAPPRTRGCTHLSTADALPDRAPAGLALRRGPTTIRWRSSRAF